MPVAKGRRLTLPSSGQSKGCALRLPLMSNVRRRRFLGTKPQSSSECKCNWRSWKHFGVIVFTANTCSLRLALLLRAATEWKATAIARWWPPCACFKQEPCGLPVPPAGGQRTDSCARKALKVKQVAVPKPSAQAHFANELKRISSRVTEGPQKSENTAACVLAGIRRQARPKYATAADA